MLTLYGMNVCYYFYILWSHFSKVILTTEEVITAIFKVISATTKVIVATEEVIIATLNVISATTKVIMATAEVITTCPMSSQILSYINIFDINRKLLAQATDV